MLIPYQVVQHSVYVLDQHLQTIKNSFGRNLFLRMLFNNSWAVIVAQLEEQQCDQKKIAKCLLKSGLKMISQEK